LYKKERNKVHKRRKTGGKRGNEDILTAIAPSIGTIGRALNGKILRRVPQMKEKKSIFKNRSTKKGNHEISKKQRERERKEVGDSLEGSV